MVLFFIHRIHSIYEAYKEPPLLIQRDATGRLLRLLRFSVDL